MSMRDDFESSFAGVYGMAIDELDQYVNADTAAAWDGWQAAREQGAGPVAYAVYWGGGDVELYEAPLPSFGDEPEAVTPLYTQPQSAGVPEAFILRKQAEAVELAVSAYEIKSPTKASNCYSYDLIHHAKRLRQQADEQEQK